MTPKRRPFARVASVGSACVVAAFTGSGCSDDDERRPSEGCTRPEGCGNGGRGAAGEAPGGAPVGGAGDEGGNEAQGGSPSAGTQDSSGKAGTSGSTGGDAAGDAGMPTTGGSGSSLGGSGGASSGTTATGGAGASGAAGNGGCGMDLLQNGDFDAAPPWTESARPSGYPLVGSEADIARALGVSFQANTPPNVVWLGGVAGDTQAAYQTVAIPARAVTLRVSGYVLIATELETPANGDQASIGLTDASSTVPLLDWGPLDANGAWTPFSLTFDASTLAGRTLSFGLGATTDGTGNTNFFFDSLSLTVCP